MNNAPIPSTKENILVVDDTPANLNLLSKLLSEQGYKVRPALNGKLAIQSIEIVKPDLILLDIMMPEMDGYEVCKQLKINQDTQNIPIVFISALHELPDKITAFELGGVDYITKPFQVEEVVLRVENQLRLSRLSKQLAERNARLQREIEERKKAEEALRQSEDRYGAIVETQTELIARFQPDGTIKFINEAYCDYFGKSQIQLIGTHYQPFIVPGELDNISTFLNSLSVDTPIGTIERQVIVAGEIRFLQWIIRAIFNSNGELLEFQAVGRDITDRKRMEDALRISQERLQLAIEGSGMGLWDWNLSTGDVYFSPEWKAMLGYDIEEIDNSLHAWEKLVHLDDLPKVWTMVNIYLEGGLSHYEMEYRMRSKSGDWTWILSRAKVMEWDKLGKPVRMTGIHLDISDRKQALEQLQQTQAQLVQNEKMASLGQLVAGVAHEINNPTSFIYGNIRPAFEYAQDLLNLIDLYRQYYPTPVPEIAEHLELIEPDFIADDFPKLLTSMKEGAERISQIVLSLRNFSHLDRGECRFVDIHDGINNTLLILQHRLKQQPHRSEIRVIKDYGQLPFIECYPGELNQVFMNILTNAIDALEMQDRAWRTANGNSEHCLMSNLNCSIPIIKIQTEVVESHSIIIRIIDNGPGIKAEVQQKIFDPFFTTKPPGAGTGLGLSLSYRIIVDKHGGKMWCRSIVGQETEFAIELPLVQNVKV